MEEKKYELTDETIEYCGKTLHRIKAIRNFGNVKVGDLGGFIEKEDNLSHDNNAWISDNAKVYGNAKVSINALVFGNAQVSDNARVFGNAQVSGDAKITKTSDYITFSGFGSHLDHHITMYRQNDDIGVCGCFCGTIDEFESRVKSVHGDSKYAKEYLSLINTAKIHFSE